MKTKTKIIGLLEILAQYEVKQTDTLESFDLAGLCDYSRRTIYLNSTLPHHLKATTLIHETLHAYYNSIEIDASEKRIERETRELTRKLYGK